MIARQPPHASGSGGSTSAERPPPEIEEVFEEFRTCEFSTIARDGTPITWPCAARYNPNETSFLLTSSVGLYSKIANVRRNRKVSLFFSDPTASGLHDAPDVLVQGEAEASDEVTAVEGLEDYWKTLFIRQPVSRLYSLLPARPFMDFYYMRIRIHVLARSIVWWSDHEPPKSWRRVG